MRILFVKKLYSPVGGSETLTYHWARNLAERGHEVRVLSLWPLFQRHRYPPRNTAIRNERHFRAFRDGGVDVFQLAPQAGALGKALDFLPYFGLMRRDLAMRLAGACDLVHNVCREYSTAAVAIARSRGVPLVLTPLPHPGQHFSGASARDFAFYRKATGIVALTRHEKEWYESLGVAPDRVVVVGAGPSACAGAGGSSFRARHGITGPMVLFVGRQERYKGYLAIAAAADAVWEAHPETRFVFIGEKSLFSSVRDSLPRRRDPRMLNLGEVSEEEKAGAYAACDIFCMPSRHETLGLTYLEAWAYRKPVIAGDIPALRTVVDHGNDGLLVPQAPAAIAGALVRLLANPALAKRMGAAGHQKVRERYAWPVVTVKLENFYNYVTTLSM